MKTYELHKKITVKAFRIRAIEGYESWPINPKETPAPTPGNMRLIYSTDDNDHAVCVDQKFIDSIPANQSGYYTMQPDGTEAFISSIEWSGLGGEMTNDD